jgi:hypothetical protein
MSDNEKQFGPLDITAFLYLKDFVMSGFPKPDLKSQVTLAYNIAETIEEYKKHKNIDTNFGRSPVQQFVDKMNTLTPEEIEYAKSLFEKQNICPKCQSTNISKIVLTTLTPTPKYIFVCEDCHFQEEREGPI